MMKMVRYRVWCKIVSKKGKVLRPGDFPDRDVSDQIEVERRRGETSSRYGERGILYLHDSVSMPLPAPSPYSESPHSELHSAPPL